VVGVEVVAAEEVGDYGGTHFGAIVVEAGEGGGEGRGGVGCGC